MMRYFILILVAQVLFFPRYGHASIFDLMLPEVALKAETIVEGEVAEKDGSYHVDVTRTLKGVGGRQLSLSPHALSPSMEFGPILKKGDKGFFFMIRRPSGKYDVFHPRCNQRLDAKQKVEDTVAMLSDPAKFLDTKEYPCSREVAFVIGELFRTGKLTCMQVLKLAPSLNFKDREIRSDNLWPWTSDERISVGCARSKTNPDYVEIFNPVPEPTMPPKTHGKLDERLMLVGRLRQRLGQPWVVEHTLLKQREIDKGLTFTIDNRKVQKVGTTTRQMARAYLHTCLASEDQRVILEALESISKMQDIDSVPAVAKLLNDKRPRVMIAAARVLGRSQQPQCLEPLITLLKKYEDNYPKNHGLIDPLAVAVARFENPKAVMALENAAGKGSARATEALRLGLATTDSMDRLMEMAKQNPRQCAAMSGLFEGLVCRSNKPIETWMDNSTWSVDIGEKQLHKWFAWWEANRKTFRIIRTSRQARIAWYLKKQQEERRKPKADQKK
jgi:hypothetical protein